MGSLVLTTILGLLYAITYLVSRRSLLPVVAGHFVLDALILIATDPSGTFHSAMRIDQEAPGRELVDEDLCARLGREVSQTESGRRG